MTRDQDRKPRADCRKTMIGSLQISVGADLRVGPGIVGVDFGAFKEFNIREGMKLRLQTQVKNLPNHPNLGNPDTNLSSGNYGRIRSLNPNFGLREVLLGARLTF